MKRRIDAIANDQDSTLRENVHNSPAYALKMDVYPGCGDYEVLPSFSSGQAAEIEEFSEGGLNQRLTIVSVCDWLRLQSVRPLFPLT